MEPPLSDAALIRAIAELAVRPEEKLTIIFLFC
jgi:hypothetical protein